MSNGLIPIHDKKANAIAHYGKLLSKGGRIVFADTMYQSEEDYKNEKLKL